MKKPQLIYLEWADAHTNMGWFKDDEVDEWAKHEWMIREAGWLIRETKEHLIFATGYRPEDEWQDRQYVNLHRIPKTWVRKRKNLTPNH